MDVDEALVRVDNPDACVDELHRTLAAEVRRLRDERDAVLGFLDDVNREEWASKVLISTAIRKVYGESDPRATPGGA